jgi:ABC-2 type transport system ATP-binding protein
VYRQDDCLFYRIFKADAAERAEASANGRPDFIRTNRLTKQYAGASTTAVDALTLGIAKGEIFGLLGPNGAGKTTTLSMLCGLLEPDSGRIEYDATINRRTVRRAIGYVPQSLALYPRLTARENLVFFGRLYGRRGKKLQRRIDDLLALVGLTERADESVKRYSTGMMRRLNLAAGLVHEPEILFLDEPTVGIDPQSRHWIFNLILDLKRKGLTILYTTHYLDEAARLCDRVAIMDRGRVLLEGAPKQIVARYGLYRLDFTAPSCPDRFTKALAQLDGVADVTCGGDGLSVYAKNAQGKMAILDTIHELAERHGVALSLQNLIEPNLESLFLDLTGKRLRDAEQE